MVSRNITIKNSVGLHARPATFFIQKANSYKSMEVTLIADGPDEVEALNGLEELVETGFED